VEEEQKVTRLGDNPPGRPKRFYQAASVEADRGFFAIALDGKPARTRARQPLGAASRALAAAIADEWNAQTGVIDFALMPMTRYQATAIDRADSDAGAWRAVTLAFLSSDLVCYRASAPAALAERQARALDPLIAFAALHGIALKTCAGIGPIDQGPAPLAAAAALLDGADGPALLGVKSAAEIAGSGVIALALWRRAFPTEDLFNASRIDEAFQAEKWGIDAEAEARERALRRDFLDVSRYLSLTASGAG